jgi:hypothetical protein
MIRPIHLLVAIATMAALVACGDKPPPPLQGNVSPPVSSAAPSPPTSTPPAIPTPSPTATGTHPAETATDSAATYPKGTMSKEQESKSMPVTGQAGSHSSTALDAKEVAKK